MVFKRFSLPNLDLVLDNRYLRLVCVHNLSLRVKRQVDIQVAEGWYCRRPHVLHTIRKGKLAVTRVMRGVKVFSLCTSICPALAYLRGRDRKGLGVRKRCNTTKSVPLSGHGGNEKFCGVYFQYPTWRSVPTAWGILALKLSYGTGGAVD